MTPGLLLTWVTVWAAVVLISALSLLLIAVMIRAFLYPDEPETKPTVERGFAFKLMSVEGDLDGARQEIRYLKHYCHKDHVETAYKAYIAGTLGDES